VTTIDKIHERNILHDHLHSHQVVCNGRKVHEDIQHNHLHANTLGFHHRFLEDETFNQFTTREGG